MNAINIIMNSARLLNDTDISEDSTLKDLEFSKGTFYQNMLEENTIEPIIISETAEELYALHSNLRNYVNALNLVIGEIATQYISLETTLTTTTTDCKISLVNLNYMAGIISIKNDKEEDVEYKIEGTDLVLETDGTYTIIYNKIPVILDIFSDVGFFADKLDYRIISYGVCSVFCLMTNRYEQYNIFEKVYRDNLPKRIMARNFTMPTRDWV